jgi:hypothetical protein
MRIESDARQSRWERVLETARGLPVRPRAAARLRISQALFHTGRLTKEMFAFAQWRGADLLPSMKDGMDVCYPLSETLLELGQVNLAEHFAHEALEVNGERPELLWLLARINVLKDRAQAARVFLNRLRKVPFHRKEAEHRLLALEADPTLAGEPDIARIRPLRVDSDYAESGIPPEMLLHQLLQANRRNRMAAEYLMAHYLLSGQTERIVRDLGVLDDVGAWETPRHIEEAILLHAAAQMGQGVDLRGRRISAGTLRRFEQIQEMLSRNGGKAAGIEAALLRDFGDTFWFYSLLGQTLGGIRPTFARGPS